MKEAPEAAGAPKALPPFAVWPVLGVSLFAKQTMLLLVIGLLVGFLVNRQWSVLRSPYLWMGAAFAVVIWLPNLFWQAGLGWPALEMSGSLQQNRAGLEYGIKFVFIQLMLPGWWAAPVWIAGLWALWREPRFRAYRAFAVAYALLFAFLILAIGDRPYYLGPLYTLPFAAVIASEVVGGSRRFFTLKKPTRRWNLARALDGARLGGGDGGHRAAPFTAHRASALARHRAAAGA